jgi:hypothetical protein
MQQRYFLFLNFLLLISCSQEPSESLSLELIVDSKQIIKKSSDEKDANKMYLDYSKIINIIGNACKYSNFLNSNIISSEVENFTTNNKSQEIEKSSVIKIKEAQETSELKFSRIQLQQEIIDCESNIQCAILPATDKAQQPQYSLQLLETFGKNYSMKSNAKWILKSKTATDDNIFEQLQLVNITLDGFFCTEKTISNQKISQSK